MPISITAEQRDALYAQVFDRLDGIDDLRMAAYAGKFEVAGRLGRIYSDDLQLVCADLGWGEGTGQPLKLATPAEVLRRVFGRMGEEAAAMFSDEKEKAAHLLEHHERHRILIEVCREGLEQLEAEAE